MEGINDIDERRIIIIQRHFKNKQLNKIRKDIFKIYNEFNEKLFAVQNNDFTIYEEAAGFFEGSLLRNFQQNFGYLMERIYHTSPYYVNLPQNGELGGNDGISNIHNCLYEAKNKYNTMKGSQSYNEIKSKLECAIQNNKKFILLICNDKKKLSRKIPLHQHQGLSEIVNLFSLKSLKYLFISSIEFNNISIDCCSINKFKSFSISFIELIILACFS